MVDTLAPCRSRIRYPLYGSAVRDAAEARLANGSADKLIPEMHQQMVIAQYSRLTFQCRTRLGR